MDTKIKQNILRQAKETLQTNDLGGWTRPTPGLYPHQWFWDSCFIAIGLRHTSVPRAQDELRALIRGQWQNGMLPHVRFSDSKEYHAGPDLWKSERSPLAPKGVSTTGITQPPMLAEAVHRIAGKLSKDKRKKWLQEMLPPVMRYHQWAYHERDPYNEGLALLIHSWECGLDNTPPWMDVVHPHRPFKVRLANQFNLEGWLERQRKDTKQVPAAERIRTSELFTLYRILGQLRSRNYDIERILQSPIPLVIDLTYNSILVRANQLLEEMAKEIKLELPRDLQVSMGKAGGALQTLQASSGEFFSRNFRTRQLIEQPSVATLLPLYSGAISQEQAAQLVAIMQDKEQYNLRHPLPSVPKNSSYFSPRRYWHGPTWININWLVIDGLRRYGYDDLAEDLRQKTLQLIAGQGMYEYFSPLDGKGAGSKPFSWTAALAIDMLQDTPKR